MNNFTYYEAFPLGDIELTDKRFMSRIDMKRWADQVEALKVDIEQNGQLDPIGVGRLENEERLIIIYGFTRTEAIRQLGWTTIRANVYENLTLLEASDLNATNNSTHNQLTTWERALQIKALKDAGMQVDSRDASERTITRIFGMSRRNVFNWFKVVDYNCPELHQAIANDAIGLKHALLFIDYPPSLVVPMLEQCIENEWSSKILNVRLKSAALHENGELSSKRTDESATLHSKQEDNSNSDQSAHSAKIKMDLDRAAGVMLSVNVDDILTFSEEKQKKLNAGIRMVLEVFAFETTSTENAKSNVFQR